MKKLQNKIWAKIIAFVLCLIGAFGTLISGFLMCVVASEPKKADMLEYCYDRILRSYSYEILDEMNTSNPDWKESLEKYQEKNWSFALMEAEESKIPFLDLTDPENYVYISGETLKDEYDFKEETSRYSYYEYNTNSLWSLLFASDYSEWDDVSFAERKVQYVVMDETTGVMYVATTDGFMAMWDVCVQTAPGQSRDYLKLEIEEDGEIYYILQSTGKQQTAEQIRNYNYISEICNAYEDYPLYWHDGDLGEGERYEENHIYVLPSQQITPRYYKNNTSIYNYEFTEYSYITYPVEDESYVACVFYGSVNDELIYNDEINQITIIMDKIYSLSGAYVFLAFGSLLIFIAGLSFLIYGAGHRKDSEEIKLSFIDKVPFEILTIVEFLIYTGLIVLFVLLMESNFVLGNATIFLTVLLLTAAVIAGIWYLISIAARVKAKRFLKNTIIYFLGHKIVQLCKFIGKNLPLFGKCLLVMIAFGIGEIISLLMWWNFCWDFEIQILVVGAWTLVETVVVFFFCCQMRILQKGMEKVAAGDLQEKVDTSRLFWEFKKHGELINKAGEGIAAAVEKQMKSERFRTELITNVSHDIKTPLTSIINYVDLIQKEDIQNENLLEYVEVLDRQSNRLKKLIEDLMEASKASTGNLPVQMEDCDVSVLLTQLIGEYQEKLADRDLELVVQNPSESVMIKADGRYLWRVFDNLMNNICKYAMGGTRVYLSMEKDTLARITFRNISRQQLNVSSEELMERFVRGDSSRNTEGSGLGLSIAQSLTILMNGKMELFVDGDLFKVILTFPLILYNSHYNNPFREQNPLEDTVPLSQPETADEQYNKKD